MKVERYAKRNKIVAEIIFKETNCTDWRNSSRHVKESYILYYVYSKFLSNTGTVQVRPHFTAVMRIRTSFNRIRIWIRIFKKLIESDFWFGSSCPDPDPDPTKKERIWISNRFVNKFFVVWKILLSQRRIPVLSGHIRICNILKNWLSSSTLSPFKTFILNRFSPLCLINDFLAPS